MKLTKLRATAAVVLVSSLLPVILSAPPAGGAPPIPLVHDYNMANLSSNERELSIAVDPNNPNRLMAGSNQRNGGQSWFASNNGGRTWTNGALPIGTLTVPSTPSPTMSDPSLAYGNDGTLYYSALAHDGGGGNIGTLFVGATTDQGVNWTDLNNGIVAAGAASPDLLQDKEHIAVDQANNNVYVAWTPIGSTNNREIVFSRDLGGVGNGFAFSAPAVITTASAFDSCLNQGADFTMVGARLYLAWTSFCSGFSDGDAASAYVTFSDDQGLNWSAPVAALSIDNVDHTAEGFRSRSHPSIDADRATGRVFLVAASNGDTSANTDGDILLTSSTDGTTWTAPTTVNPEPSASDQDEQWMPWVAVGNGRVNVVYFCWDDEGTSINACMAYAPVGASPSFTEITISSAATPTTTGFLGDYNGNFVGSDDVVHPAWGDGRSGNGGATDAYSARVDFSPPSSVSAVAPASLPWGQTATVTATVLGANSEAEQFIPVSFTVTGGGSPSPSSGSGITNAAGQRSFSFTNPTASTNNVHIWADLDEDGIEDAGEATDKTVTWTAHPTSTAYTGPSSGTYSDAVTLAGRLTDTLTNTPVAGETLVLSVGTDSCFGTTDAGGSASCSATLTQVPGPYTATAAYGGSPQYVPSQGSRAFTIMKETTVTVYSGPTIIANNLPATLTATLREDDGPPVVGRTVTMTLGTGIGAQSCNGVTDAVGDASCTIGSVNQPLGPGTVVAAFAGDAYYLSSSATASTIIFQWTAGGNFVIGDGNAATGSSVLFWGSQWSRKNSVSGGRAPLAFKGFSNSPSGPTVCGGKWSTSGGNSPPPAGSVPAYTAMLGTSKVTKNGKTISGTKPIVVIVQVNAGYSPAPGKAGTGTVVATLCP